MIKSWIRVCDEETLMAARGAWHEGAGRISADGAAGGWKSWAEQSGSEHLAPLPAGPFLWAPRAVGVSLLCWAALRSHPIAKCTQGLCFPGASAPRIDALQRQFGASSVTESAGSRGHAVVLAGGEAELWVSGSPIKLTLEQLRGGERSPSGSRCTAGRVLTGSFYLFRAKWPW